MKTDLISKMKEEISSKRIDQMTDQKEIEDRIYLINRIRDSFPIDEHKIVFLNFSGNFDCNVKYIALKILETNPKYELIWGTFEHNHIDDPDNFPGSIKVFIRESYEFYALLSSAKYIFDNSINMALIGYTKKPDQILIETWHGAMGIKMFGPKANGDEHWHSLARKESNETNYIISNSKLENDVYRSTFWKKTKILRIGHPRNDVLFYDKKRIDEIKKNFFKRYNINEDYKLCLYAPTFRDNHELDIYMLDIDSLKKTLSNRFGGEWAILYRYHDGIIRTYWDETKYPDGVISVSDYPDVQEILAIIDLGITDYSSWICEYVLRQKPGFLYAPDYNSYVDKERKLLMPLEKLPFPLATDEETLLSNIKAFNEKDYVEKCKKFIKKHGNVDKGDAAMKLVNLIINN